MTNDQYNIPTWDNGEWTHTQFKDKDAYLSFVTACFKEPGKYGFNEDTNQIFNEQGNIFFKQGFYCDAPFMTKDFINYWDNQKEKNRKGLIVKSKGNSFYLTRDYYMWLNFLPIYNKEIKKFGLAKIRDAQYHMALYEILAELNNVHAAILKKRQIASSYFHCCKVINQFWFEEGSVCKMGASFKDYINEKGSWKFLDEYKNFLNENTAWYRPTNPGKVMTWFQAIKATEKGRDKTKGLKSSLTGMSFDKDPTNGVGGPCSVFFHEEAGIAPRMMDTYEFMRPALSSGMTTTGIFIAAGSVGDLDQCQPLKQMILYPDDNDIYSVETNLIDDKGTIGKAGLFIPEQWSMPPYIDDFGNSLVEEALKAIKEERKDWKKKLPAAQYQLRISQKPTNIAEAFDYRKEAYFPVKYLAHQRRLIEDKTYYSEYVDLSFKVDGSIKVEKSNKAPITDFPISPKTEDKVGSIVIYERPDDKAPWGTYIASVDPVSEGKTTSTDSLCSIIVYKNTTEVRRMSADGSFEVFVEPGKIVATWCGRFDDLKRTQERLELIIQWYNAWTIVENNIPGFIQHMINRRKQKYLVPKDQIVFLKELKANANVFQEYGWKNTGTMFKNNMLPYVVDFITEEQYASLCSRFYNRRD